MTMNSDYYRKLYGDMAEGRFQQRFVATQKGNGFFGRIIRGSLMPIIKSVLPYLKDVALEGVGSLVTDLQQGKTLKDAASSSLKKTSSTVLNDVAKRVAKAQTGSGVKRKKKSTQRGRGVSKRRTIAARRPSGRQQHPFKI